MSPTKLRNRLHVQHRWQIVIPFFVAAWLACDFNQSAVALPPLELSQLTSSPTSSAGLEVIGGNAYVSTPNGVWIVSSSGVEDHVPITHPELGSPLNITRVVQANDGNLYVASNFLVTNIFAKPALYKLDQPSFPIVTWDFGFASTVTSNLAVFGNIESSADFEATQFFVDGSFESLQYPGDGASLNSATASGYALGDAHIPETIGSAPGIWSPSGEFSFLNVCCVSSSIRDRLEGDGVNVGWDGAGVKYGSAPAIYIKDVDGSDFGGWSAIVSHSDFVVVQDSLDSRQTKYAFYPGIVPGFPDRAMPLLDVFPELASIDIDVISDLASVDGYLYMTLSGADGTFLFGARDPSVIPEPGTVVFCLLVLAVFPRHARILIS